MESEMERDRYWAASGIRGAILLLFFTSGAAGLIYEVIWTRYLTTLFGATLPAVSTVLAAFMGGLALGSFVIGPASDRMRRPLRFYAFLELGIAVGALMTPLMLKVAAPLSQPILGDFDRPILAVSLFRFAVNFIVLLIPTTLMGATLPALSRFLVHRRESLGLNVGGLYAANTFGAVTGTALTGFVLISWIGVFNSMLLAAGLNALVFLVSLRLSARIERDTPETPDTRVDAAVQAPPEGRRMHRIALATYGFSGFVALCLQVVWTRGLAFTTDVLRSSTYSFSAMLTVFLLGLAAGGAVLAPRVDRHENPPRLYGLILTLLGISAGLSGIVLFNIAPVLRPAQMMFLEGGEYVPFWMAALDLFLNAILVLGLPTFLMGMAFPAAAKLCVPDLRRVGGSVGRLYAANTVGAILGAFAAGFILIPWIGLSRTVWLMAAVEMGLGLIVLWSDRRTEQPLRWGLSAAAALAALLFYVRMPERDETFRNAAPINTRVLAYAEGPLATVSVIEDSLGYREILVDNVGVAGTNRIMLTDQKSLAHLPALLVKDPKAALTVGFGSGGASYSYLLHPFFEVVNCVEIAETVLRRDLQRLMFASSHRILEKMAEGRLPRFNILLADARSYLRFSDRRYDSIATDCTDLRYKSNANLYDLEYFRLCRERLTEDGMVVVWMPLGGLTRDLFKTALGTFQEVFDGEQEMHVWYFNNDTVHYCLLVGINNPEPIDYNQILERISHEPVTEDLAEIDLSDPEKIMGCYVTGGPPLAELLEGARINTENNPVLEFETPLAPYEPGLIWDNLRYLYSNRQSVLTLIDPDTISEDKAQEIRDYERAAPIIADGLRAQHEQGFHVALKHFEEAAEITPDDNALKYLQTFPYLRRAYRISLDKYLHAARLGRIEYERGNYAEALEYFDLVIDPPEAMPQVLGTQKERDEAYIQSLAYAGLSHAALGNAEKAGEMLEELNDAAPDSNAKAMLSQALERP